MPSEKAIETQKHDPARAAKAQCHDWNTAHSEGATVLYEELLGSGEKIQTKTCGKAFVICCEPVIMVEDVSGAVSLDHCTVVAEHAAA